MFNFISGKVAEKGDNLLVLENNGIGFELTVTDSCIERVGIIGTEAKIFSYMAVREDNISLFGFYSKEEKSTFLKLISISGIGPKLAITILSHISAANLAIAIVTSDIAALNKIKGVGKKTAERIILELKEKMEIGSSDGFSITADTLSTEATLALTALGISKTEAYNAVQKVRGEADTIEKLIIAALKGLNK